MNLLYKIIGTNSERKVKKVTKQIKSIVALEDEMKSLSDEELQGKTAEFKKRLQKGETVDDLLPEAFAVCREASSRVLGMRHYEVQLIGGIILHEGNVAEMKTGEGKTLVATLPVYLNALSGEGVHVVTVNDYLATRDLGIMKPLYDFLQLSSSVITGELTMEEKREAYHSDITYITNSELGFDYLRDNMVKRKVDKMQRPLHFCIVDEVDSILLDEARTPLIISGPGEEPSQWYAIVDMFVRSLHEDDYTVDEKIRVVMLTDSGMEKAEKMFRMKNYADLENTTIRHHVDQSLQAHYFFKRDKDYLVKNGEVFIIDEHTGRVSEGRRYSNGLHQAMEAKEGVRIQEENKTLASITYQNFFLLYKRLSGMTGTAETEEVEFRETYGLEVVVIPTNQPVQRKDKQDKLYFTEKAKFIAIVEDIKKSHAKGQPVLVGTSTIEKSEELSDLLTKEGIPHQVLNAKFHDIEAEIIMNAGQKGAVTIATNMAGRGTDIKLGEGVTEVGGLKVIGSERHDNRRIDNQLRGRSGRQGDKGISRFYVSFEDDLMRVFASDKIKEMISLMPKDDNDAVENKFLTKAIGKCQRNLEAMHYDARKETMKYDSIINEQRKVIYQQRDDVLEPSFDIVGQLESMARDAFESEIAEKLHKYEEFGQDEDLQPALEEMKRTFKMKYSMIGVVNVDDALQKDIEEIKESVLQNCMDAFEVKKELVVQNEIQEQMKQILLEIVDKNWIHHIDSLTDLKQDVKLAVYNQKKPIEEFLFASSKLFNELGEKIQVEMVQALMRIRFVEEEIIENVKEIA
ncbi:preprotein translocase subunit SecA [Bacillus cereus]|uniref:preprotein translocase subunit SecA n=1 Tax=Bacillus cereus TaxID=1396 RepID=UPI002406DB1A|nr:preprotein translocase subunit SecA [Bacillus cereus]MDF9599425.1 preprotein translocase subunit SecA [Bacillus cereus]MDG1589757.1 preprotein translocase subunit SecA [Bacillus cereus]